MRLQAGHVGPVAAPHVEDVDQGQRPHRLAQRACARAPAPAATPASRGSRSPARSAPEVIMPLIFSMASSVTATAYLRCRSRSARSASSSPTNRRDPMSAPECGHDRGRWPRRKRPGMTAPPGTNECMTRDEAERCLRLLAGPHAQLRDDQWTAISPLVDGRRALVVQRTGWGKSAVYFVAASLLRAAARARRSSSRRCWPSCATRSPRRSGPVSGPGPSTRRTSTTGTRSAARSGRAPWTCCWSAPSG